MVRLLHPPAALRAAFDDASLVSCAGLVPVMRLAYDAGLHDLVRESVGSNPGARSPRSWPG
jgi:hypothetical protein